MSAIEKGKSCSLCNRDVFDFLNWPDEAIIHFLNKSDGPTCGRLSREQINRIISIQDKSKINNRYKIVASIFLFLSSANLHASENPAVLTEYNRDYQSIHSFPKVIKNKITNDSTQRMISGLLMEKDSKQPIKNVSIEIKGTPAKTQTDSLCYFELFLSENYSKNEIVLLVLDDYGFEGPTESTVYKNQLPMTDLFIEKPGFLIGEIMYSKQKKWWQFWKKRLN
ncbi:hypothetical protein [Sphingobacterium hungaricum]|nr:hypothetical protein [Sphingobacterium hungaricum]